MELFNDHRYCLAWSQEGDQVKGGVGWNSLITLDIVARLILVVSVFFMKLICTFNQVIGIYDIDVSV